MRIASVPSADLPERATAPPTVEPIEPPVHPAAAPATVVPPRYQLTVVRQCPPRDRSPSGVMLPSIDSPQGDHADRMPATTASPTPTPTIALIPGSGRRGRTGPG